MSKQDKPKPETAQAPKTRGGKRPGSGRKMRWAHIELTAEAAYELGAIADAYAKARPGWFTGDRAEVAATLLRAAIRQEYERYVKRPG